MTLLPSNIETAQSKLTRAAIIFALGAIVAFCNARSASAQPSFNCKTTYSAGERVICKNNELAKLDRWMSSEYHALYRSMNRKEKRILKNDQRKWLKIRNRCGASPGCISEQYYFRIAELVEWNL